MLLIPGGSDVYTVIIPIYKNEETLPDVVSELEDLARRIEAKGDTFCATFVVDGSPDNSADLLRNTLLPQAKLQSRLIEHSRNFGSFAAIRTGLSETEADYYGMIAADRQEPTELLDAFYEKLRKNTSDVVIGVRVSRDDPQGSKAASGLFWSLYRRVVMPEVPAGGVDLFGCTKQVRNELISLSESNSSLVAQLFWLGFKRSQIPYTRRKRMIGKSGWTFRKKVKYLMDSIYAFTDLPIRLITASGLFGMGIAVLYGVFVVFARLFGYVADPGYAATIISILFFGGLNAFAIGIVGAYGWRTYENTKRRPLSVVSRRDAFTADGAHRSDTAMASHEDTAV